MERPPRKDRFKFHPNDGRAPDTIAALQNSTGVSNIAQVLVTTTLPPQGLSQSDAAIPTPLVLCESSEKTGTRPQPAHAVSTRLVACASSQNLNSVDGPLVGRLSLPPETDYERQERFSKMSYSLYKNSCFTDHPIEAWFRAYLLWPLEVRQEVLRNILPLQSVLASSTLR